MKLGTLKARAHRVLFECITNSLYDLTAAIRQPVHDVVKVTYKLPPITIRIMETP